MLSILVPVYNFQVVRFVTDLQAQATACGQPFEILVYDDGSTAAFKAANKVVQELDFVTYYELPENLGRSRIRNRLTQDANYDFLLFVDCDSLTISDQYIQNYLDNLDPKVVLYGGRVYAPEPPTDHRQYLRWYYGVERETIAVDVRNTMPYRYFLTNNYLIPRKIQEETPFHETLVGYGHEDTLLGHDLKEKGITLQHIDNPLCHIGLEDATDFLDKTRQGIQNLVYIIEAGFADDDIRIFRFYHRIRKLGLYPILKLLFRMSRKQLEKNLTSKRPSLRYFDFYKLGCLLESME